MKPYGYHIFGKYGECDKPVGLPGCPSYDCITCGDCKEMGAKCVADMGKTKQCNKLGYIPETNQCEDDIICMSLHPTKCSHCEQLGPYCVNRIKMGK